ncbi:MAG: alpha/beta hydrolase [Gemmatimonadales bacterium]
MTSTLNRLASSALSVAAIAMIACADNGGQAPLPPSLPPPPPPPSGENIPPITGSPAAVQDIGTFQSAILGNTRRLWVYIPPGYTANPTARYPVLYVHDGQTAFSPMNFDDEATRVIQAMEARPIIIVAVESTSDRYNEYMPFVDHNGKGGKGELYSQMLITELKPYIDSRYRTLTDAAHTGTTGQSAGGVITWWLALEHPDHFNLMAAQSAPLQLGSSGSQPLVTKVHNLPSKLPDRIWFDRGTSDGEDWQRQAEQVMRQELIAKGWVDGVDLRYVLVAGGTHSTGNWSQRVGEILKFLFPRS